MWIKLLFTSFLLAIVNCENAPVIFWGKSPTVLPALNNLNADEFVALVQSKLDENTLTLVFVESQLSVEDFSQCKLRSTTCFENLSKVQGKTYLPSVESPVEALKGLSEHHKSILLSNDGDVSENIKAEGGKVIFINLDEIVSKFDFAKHDSIINELYESIAAKYDNVLAIYTSKAPSFTYSKTLSRKTRQVESVPQQKVEYVENLVFVAMSGMTFKAPGAAPATIYDNFTLAAILDESIPDDKIMNVTIKSIDSVVDVVLRVHLIAGSWEVKTVSTSEANFHPNHRILASDDSSFACGDLHLIGIKPDLTRITITFENFQMQPIFKTNGTVVPADFKFGQPWNCTGFFSAGIWGGLFIVILFLTIMSYGISWIMDIKTMSQFDDPKGKTITINAAE